MVVCFNISPRGEDSYVKGTGTLVGKFQLNDTLMDKNIDALVRSVVSSVVISKSVIYTPKKTTSIPAPFTRESPRDFSTLLPSDPNLSCRIGVRSTTKCCIDDAIMTKVVFVANYITLVSVEFANVTATVRV